MNAQYHGCCYLVATIIQHLSRQKCHYLILKSFCQRVFRILWHQLASRNLLAFTCGSHLRNKPIFRNWEIVQWDTSNVTPENHYHQYGIISQRISKCSWRHEWHAVHRGIQEGGRQSWPDMMTRSMPSFSASEVRNEQDLSMAMAVMLIWVYKNQIFWKKQNLSRAWKTTSENHNFEIWMD